MRVILSVVFLLLILVTALMWKETPPRAELNIGYSALQTLDPQQMRSEEDIRVGYALFEGLTSFDSQTFTIKPGVAQSWEISADRRTFTFHLRHDAKWSDGRPINAEDFRWSWWHGMMPDQAAEYSYFLMFIKGAKAYNQWCTDELTRINKLTDPAERLAAAEKRVEASRRKFDELVTGVKVVDPYTLQLQTEDFLPYFLEVTACWPLFPVPRHALERVTHIDGSTLMYRRDKQWTRPSNAPATMIGNGPFRLVTARFKRDMYMVANEHYWNAANVGVKSIQMTCYADPSASFTAYETGSIDLMFSAQSLEFCSELLEAQREGKRKDVHDFDSYGTYYFLFNNSPKLASGEKNPLADVRVRRAFARVVDKKALVENVTRVRQTPANVFIPVGAIGGYHSPKGLPCLSDAKDENERKQIIETAKRELADAGYPDGKGFPAITIVYNADGGHKLVSDFLRDTWARTLNVHMDLQTLEFKVLLDRRSEGAYVIARSGWTGDYSDPTTFLNLFRTGNGDNESKFSDPKVDALLEEADRTVDPQKRFGLLEEVERIAMDDEVPFLPLYHYKLVHLYNPDRISGVTLHPRNMQMFAEIRVKH